MPRGHEPRPPPCPLKWLVQLLGASAKVHVGVRVRVRVRVRGPQFGVFHGWLPYRSLVPVLSPGRVLHGPDRLVNPGFNVAWIAHSTVDRSLPPLPFVD